MSRSRAGILAVLFFGLFWWFWPKTDGLKIDDSGFANFDAQVKLELNKVDTKNSEQEKSKDKIKDSSKKVDRASEQPFTPEGKSDGDGGNIAIVNFAVKNGFAVIGGDVIIGRVKSDFTGEAGKAQISAIKPWPNGIVPYVISEELGSRDLILAAMNEISQISKIQFIPKVSEKDFVYFQPGEEHCYSQLGYLGIGGQSVYVSSDCGFREIIHEILHSLGMIHEHSRPDRDKFVEVLWDNLERGYEINFASMPMSLVKKIDLGEFDFSSVMIYEPYAFSYSSSQPTLRSRVGGKVIAPTKQNLSPGDIEKLQSLYGAP